MHVLVVDAHPLFSRAVGELLLRLAPGSQVKFVTDLAQARGALEEAGVDLIVADPTVPGAEHVSLIRELRSLGNARVVIVSAHDHPALVRSVFMEGAVGFIPKTAAPEAFEEALQRVLAGGSHFPSFVYAFAESEAIGALLTPRELTVMRLIAAGKQNREIAQELALGLPTVKSHVKHIYAKLGVKTRVAASLKAQQQGILPGSDAFR